MGLFSALLAAAHFTLGSMTVAHKTFRTAFLRSVVATVLALLATTSQAVFYSGGFDPPDLSGTHTFELLGTSCFATDGPTSVNDGDINDCVVTLTNLSVLLDHSFSLNFSTFIPFSGINSILVAGGQLAGVDTDLIGPATVGAGTYAGNWWIRYYYFFGDFTSDPVDLFHNCTDCAPVDTAYTVTFFLSDANGNPIDQIPEPGSLVLIAAALGAGWLARRRVAASN
jgi:hypothetical protein